jgi:hypothetical protein
VQTMSPPSFKIFKPVLSWYSISNFLAVRSGAERSWAIKLGK